MSVSRDQLATYFSRVGSGWGITSTGVLDSLLEPGIAQGNPDTFGWFSYANTMPTQTIPGNVWTTIMNDGAGPISDARFHPDGVTRMLDPATGLILLDELADGDEVYIRHIVNLIPLSNLVQYNFSHYFPGDLTRIPASTRTTLSEGGGVPTQRFLLDTHVFMDNIVTRTNGMQPQVYVSAPSVIEYSGCYISVSRRGVRT